RWEDPEVPAAADILVNQFAPASPVHAGRQRRPVLDEAIRVRQVALTGCSGGRHLGAEAGHRRHGGGQPHCDSSEMHHGGSVGERSVLKADATHYTSRAMRRFFPAVTFAPASVASARSALRRAQWVNYPMNRKKIGTKQRRARQRRLIVTCHEKVRWLRARC